MPFNGSGVFQRVYSWVQDRANGIVVSADRTDTEDNGFAAGLSNCICKDGQTTITNNIPMANFKFTGLGSGTTRTDSVNVGQVQDSGSQWSTVTAGTQNAITVSTTPAITAYVAGQTVRFIAPNSNTGPTTIAWSGLAAKNAFWANAAMGGGEIVAGREYEATYDGAQFQVNGATPLNNSSALLGNFAASQQATPNMTVLVNKGSLENQGTGVLTVVAAQSTGTITAPGGNPRNDLVVIDALTGVVSVITGTPAVSPTDPTITNGKIPIARVRLATTTTAITNSLIDDIRQPVPTAAPDAAICQGRLTLSSGTPIPFASLQQPTLYFTPYKGNQIGVYNGASWQRNTFAEMSIAAPATTNTNYDVFFDYNSGTPQLSLLVWTNDTTRATALTTQDGIYVLSGTPTKRYLGTVRTGALSGFINDGPTQKFVYNYYNRVARQMVILDTTDTWTYSTAAFRQANANANNQFDFVIGVTEDMVSAVALSVALSSTSSNRIITTGIGLDSTTVNGAQIFAQANVSNVGVDKTMAWFNTQIAVGKHSLMWLERGAGADTQTWYGDNGSVATQTGMVGTIYC